MHAAKRPVSPHLQVYRWQITMLLSSMHRMTGLLLSLGAVVLAMWLLALAGGSASYNRLYAITGAAWFKVPLVLWAFCLFFHLANGIRHLFWDATYGFERAQIWTSGIAVATASALATAAFASAIIF
jgi:succinate dehydrogenase / fumarate reductase cytochrome b subunit